MASNRPADDSTEGWTGSGGTPLAVPELRRNLHRRRRRGGSGVALRLVCHVAGTAPFLIAAITETDRGYRPSSDDAVIALRSWDVLTTHGPLVGQYTNASGSVHAVYDPGPLLYWFLTIPVHVDHSTGVLWGAAILCMAGVVVAIQAARSVRGTAGSIGVVAIVLVVIVAQPSVALDPAWNPSVGLIWFLTTVATAWATASGRLVWTPVLVLAGSFAAQAHLIFAVAAVACILVAPTVGILQRRQAVRWPWLGASLAVGVACWIAPLVQELTAHPGNLSLLMSSTKNGKLTGS